MAFKIAVNGINHTVDVDGEARLCSRPKSATDGAARASSSRHFVAKAQSLSAELG
jgi:hypothetical protein